MSQGNKTLKKLSSNKQAVDLMAKLAAEGFSDSVIAKKLHEKFDIMWSRNSIYQNRKKLGLLKGQPKTQQSSTDLPVVVIDKKSVIESSISFDRPPINLSETEKSDWFRSKFKQTHLYKALFDQFDMGEIEVYIQEYGIICCQFEDLVASEFFQIDDFLKHRILINRELVTIKKIQMQISSLNDWLLSNPQKFDEDEKETAIRIETSRLIDIKHAMLLRISERYDKLVAERDKIHKALAATRRDRIDELKTNTTNFFDIVLQIQQNSDARLKNGQYAELTKQAAEDIDREYRKDIVFPDGTKSPIILDDAAYDQKDDVENDTE